MANWTYAVGSLGWQAALLDLFTNGTFAEAVNDAREASLELSNGNHLTIKSGSDSIDASQRTITGGTGFSFELWVGGKLIFAATGYASRDFSDVQAVLDNATHQNVLSLFAPEAMKITGSAQADSLVGGAFNDTLLGGDQNDTLTGAAGADSLDGGKGTDSLSGGTGDDIYVVNVTTDVVVESVDEGNDLVQFLGEDGTYILSANVERLTLLGDESISGIGNDGDNTLTGNGASNSLSGAGGKDSISGGDGKDTLLGGSGNDTIVGGLENDVVSGGSGNDNLDGSRKLTDDDDSYDVLSYSEDQPASGATAVRVSWLSANNYAGNVTDNWGDSDTFKGFDVVRGSDLGDTFVGSSGNNWAEGMGGADTFTGASGVDTFGYDAEDKRFRALEGHAATHGVTVNLEVSIAGSTINGRGIDLWGNIDTLQNVENVSGSNLSDILNGSRAANHLMGHDGNDTISGLAGNDRLDGDRGSDSLSGGDGIDTIDGGEDNDRLFGGAGDDDLYGDTGDDMLDGGAGRDRFHGGDGLNTVSYSSSTKGIVANLDDDGENTGDALGDSFDDIDNLVGSKYGDRLTGDKHNNILDGSKGADVLKGLAGNDTYVVDNAGDKVDETGGGGSDTVRSSMTFSLNASKTVVGTIENLVLVNAAGTTVTGTGTTRGNLLDGYSGAGVAKLSGGLGNDVYVVGAGDTVSETTAGSTGGTDTVRSYVTFTLGANLENLALYDTAAINGTGNTLNNSLTGNSAKNSLKGGSGNDTLAGGLGNDALNGGAGNDVFLFNSKLPLNVDTIVDFVRGEDRLALDDAIFKALGATFEAKEFVGRDVGHAATNADQRVIYDKSNGTLWYDVDGVGSQGPIQFAQLGTTTSHPSVLSYADFYIV